eukprot:CAMPEP_0172656588 /NCGR_PEP_ID=MMETSP1074-20121228/1465_1 /TAXON_ID=2916 /ORGANISM="Ceratium fusus, Strain PA161109" /LENGTH=451 /DNA_ID=CAMNT_0013471453 /DNA_START=69 /DNA_END=1424 /DNA_ORIENTATION=-
MASPIASLTAEFLGTYLLVLTIGCNVLSGNTLWAGVSIACALMVGIYALGAVSGANFNPAVSIALACAGKMGWGQAVAYSVVQVGGALAAAGTYSILFLDTFNLGPTKGYHWGQAMACETLYTFMLCFVVLNTAASKRLGGKNQFYGLAIGFVIVAGAYGPGAVSGGCFNPAVAIGIDVVSARLGFGWCLLYTVFEILGGLMAVLAFVTMRPEERDITEPPINYDLSSKLVGEAIGTYMLVLTVGLNVLGASKAAAFSIAASLMCMIYSVGDVSGAHLNPAVTLAICGRGKISLHDAILYMVTQVFSGLLAAFTYQAVHDGTTFRLGPGDGFGWKGVAAAEIAFTFVLCLVVLCVATTERNPGPQFTGLIIGMCVTVGGLAIGKISGGSLNPAVSLGIATSRKVVGGGTFSPGLTYSALEFFAGLAASIVFRILYPKEYATDAYMDKSSPA